MHAFFSGFQGRTAAAAARTPARGRTLLAELALGFTPYLLVLAAVLLVGH